MSEKKLGKRLLTWVLVLVMMLSLLPVSALANWVEQGGHGGGGNPSTDPNSPEVEFWCTNATVSVSGYGTGTALSTLLSNKKSLYFAEEAALQSGTINLSNYDKGIGRLWKAVVQSNRNKQTGNAGDDKTAVGTQITAISRDAQGYTYVTTAGTEEHFKSSETLVLYYKQAFASEPNYGVVYGTDWGYSTRRDESPLKVTYTIRLENTTTDLATKDYWYNEDDTGTIKGIGALLNAGYELSKVTVDDKAVTPDANGEVTLDRKTDHTVIFYIKPITKIKVDYTWVGAPESLQLPTDNEEHLLNTPVSLTDLAKTYQAGTVNLGNDGMTYVFSGWFLNPDYTGAPVTDSFTVTAEQHTLYGRWVSPVAVVDLNGAIGAPMFQKTLSNADKLTDSDSRTFTVTVKNANDVYTGTATVSNVNPTAAFTFDKVMLFDIYDVGVHPYTVQETSGSYDDITYDTSTYTMTVTVTATATQPVALTATVNFSGTEQQSITFTNTVKSTEPEPSTTKVDYFLKTVNTSGADVKAEGITYNSYSNRSHGRAGWWADVGSFATTEELSKDTVYKSTDGSGKIAAVMGGTFTAHPDNPDLNKLLLTPYELKWVSDDASWHLDSTLTVYHVTYDDGVDEADAGSVSGVPTDNKYYLKDATYSVSAPDPQREGYTFAGWMRDGEKVDSSFQITGDTTLVAAWKENKTEPEPEPQPEPQTVTVTYKVVNGTWDGTSSEDKTFVLSLENGKAMLGDTIPTGMTPNAGYEGGSWNSAIDVNTTITTDTTYTYTFAPKQQQPEIKPGTISGTLSTLVSKTFTSAYGYTATQTFTAKATVGIGEELIGYYNGTVTLGTGETRNFAFTAEGNDTLQPNTTYTVAVTEDEAYQSYVICDTTTHTFTFTTDESGKLADGSTGTTIYNNYVYQYIPYYPPVTPPTVEIDDDDALGLNTTDHFAYIVGYGNGQVRPQNAITRAEVATIFFRLLTDDVREENFTSTNKYTDVAAGAWYNNAVSTLSAMGIITGYPDGTFRPNAYITRAEFAAIAARFDADGDKTLAAFSDIANHWAKDEISVAYNNGWVDGYPDGTFGPQRNITRAETVTLVNRVLNRKPETEDDLLPDMTTWTDNADKKAWYYLAIQEATNSHYYKYKENSEYEKWTELRETRDWTQLEK